MQFLQTPFPDEVLQMSHGVQANDFEVFWSFQSSSRLQNLIQHFGHLLAEGLINFVEIVRFLNTIEVDDASIEKPKQVFHDPVDLVTDMNRRSLMKFILFTGVDLVEYTQLLRTKERTNCFFIAR